MRFCPRVLPKVKEAFLSMKQVTCDDYQMLFIYIDLNHAQYLFALIMSATLLLCLLKGNSS